MVDREAGDACAARLRAALNVELERLLARDRVDMSGEAITQRLRDACELSALCLALGAADVAALDPTAS